MKKEKEELNISQSVNWQEMMQYIPVRNEAAGFVETVDGKIKVTVKKLKHKFLVPPISWIIRPKSKQEIILDDIGMTVVKMCDAKKNIENIIDEFAAVNGLTFHESRVAITDYIKNLVRRGILALVKK